MEGSEDNYGYCRFDFRLIRLFIKREVSIETI